MAYPADVQMKDGALSQDIPWDMNDFDADFDFDDLVANAEFSQFEFHDHSGQNGMNSGLPRDSAAVEADNNYSCLPTAESDNPLPAQETFNTRLPQNPVKAQPSAGSLYQDSLLATSPSWQDPAPVDPALGIANDLAAAQTINEGFCWNAFPAMTPGAQSLAQNNFCPGEPQGSAGDAMLATLLDPQFRAEEDLAADPNVMPNVAPATEKGFESRPWHTHDTSNQFAAGGGWMWVPRHDYPYPPSLDKRLPLPQLPSTFRANDVSGSNFEFRSGYGLQPPELAPHARCVGHQRPRYPYIPPPMYPQHPQHPLSPWLKPASRSPFPTATASPMCHPSGTRLSSAQARYSDPHDMPEVRNSRGTLYYVRPSNQVPAWFLYNESDAEDNPSIHKLQPCVCQCGNVHDTGNAPPQKPIDHKTLPPPRSVAPFSERKRFRVEKPRAKPRRTSRIRAQSRVPAEHELEKQDQGEGELSSCKTACSSGLVASALTSKYQSNEKLRTQAPKQHPRTRAQSRMHAERERKENEKKVHGKGTELEDGAENYEQDEDDRDEDDEDDENYKDYEDTATRSPAPLQSSIQPSRKAYGTSGVDISGRPLSLAVKVPIRRSLHPGRHIQVEQTAAVMKRNLKRRERYREQLPLAKRMEYDLNAAKAKGLI